MYIYLQSAMGLKNKTILITSNEPWGDIWYTKHNYAFELSKNNKVFFLNPPTNWKPSNLFSNKIVKRELNKNLFVLNYKNYLPLINIKSYGTSDVFGTNRVNNYLVSNLIKRFFNKEGISEYVLWSFDPQRLYDPYVIGAAFGIFHCADKHWIHTFGTHILCKKSNVLFLTSEHLLDEYDCFNLPKYIVPHGISSDQFEIKQDKANELSIPVSDYGLFIGVIDGRVDYALLEKVLIEFPDQAFVFVGPLKENHIYEESYRLFKKIFIEKAYQNLYHLGPKHFKTLKYYIFRSRFCISFMDPMWPGNTIGHHKTLVYLAQGKAVFQYRFKDYYGQEDILYMAEEHKSTINQMRSFLKKGEAKDLVAKRISYAKEKRFDSLINKIEQYLKTLNFK